MHPLRDLSDKIYALAKDHPGYSQAYGPIQNCVDHLCAMARIAEANKLNAQLVVKVEELENDPN